MIGALVGAIITALITAYINRRSKTGKINTSEAKDLWDTLRSELARLQAEATALRTELAVARGEMTALREETANLRNNVGDLVRQLEECQHREEEIHARPKPRGSTKNDR